jgi:hypothetical protein
VLKVLKYLTFPFVVLFLIMAIITVPKVNMHVPAHGAGWGSPAGRSGPKQGWHGPDSQAVHGRRPGR